MAPHDSDSTASTFPQHDLPTPDALLGMADVFFGAGLVGMAGQLAALAARHGADADAVSVATQRVDEARATDAAAVRLGANPDEFLIPSIERLEDGSPAFFLPVPAEAAGQAEVLQVVAQEVQGDGVDAELRTFLAAMLQPGDTLIDCDPGFGLALLSAGSRHRDAIRLTARAADVDHAPFLRRACEANGIQGVSIVPPVGERPQTLDALLRGPAVAQAERLIVHAGHADDLAAMATDLATVARHPRLAAIIWSVGSDEATTQAAEALSALGTQHFVVAVDANGAVLVPRDAVDGATLIVSLTSRTLDDRQAA